VLLSSIRAVPPKVTPFTSRPMSAFSWSIPCSVIPNPPLSHFSICLPSYSPSTQVPRSAPLLSARRVLTMEWVDGEKLPNLPLEDQKLMVAAGLDACFAQLLGTGVSRICHMMM